MDSTRQAGNTDTRRLQALMRCVRLLGVTTILLSVLMAIGLWGDGKAQTVSAAGLSYGPAQPWSPPPVAFKIFVKEDGFYALSYSDLTAVGWPASASSLSDLRMVWMGREMPIEVEDVNGSSLFDSGDIVRFYGRSVDSLYAEGILPDHKYTDTNVYWLIQQVSATPALRVSDQIASAGGTVVDALPHTVHVEDQIRYAGNLPKLPNSYQTADEDHWFATRLFVGNIGQLSFATPNVVAASTETTITVRLVGSNAERRPTQTEVGLQINGQAPASSDPTTWSGQAGYALQMTLPSSSLVDSSSPANTLAVTVIDADGLVYVDWLKATYLRALVLANGSLSFTGKDITGPWRYQIANPTAATVRAYDVTDLYGIQRMTNLSGDSGGDPIAFGDDRLGRHYVVQAESDWLVPAGIEADNQWRSSLPASALRYTPDDLLSSANRATWLAITHQDFFTETLRLADYRESQFPLHVVVLDVQDIYDQFNGGLMSAESIQEFLAYANANWERVPEFVLLVGAGTQELRYSTSSWRHVFIPPYLAEVDLDGVETAADNRFVMLTGNDLLPDMAIGRFPAYLVQDIATIISKTINYETNTTMGDPWTQTLLFAADNPDSGGNFHQYSDEVSAPAFVPDIYKKEKVYLGDHCADAAACRQQIVNTLNITGALFLSYIGHASEFSWAAERIWANDSVYALNNADKLAVFLPMACREGSFHKVSPSLAESYLFPYYGSEQYRYNGAVASWSATGLGFAAGHDILEKGLFRHVFGVPGDETVQTTRYLGKATGLAKQYLHDNYPGEHEDLFDTFLLFGDPALQLPVQSAIPTAVDVANMNVETDASATRVQWQTLSESDIIGFHLRRSDKASGPFDAVTADLIAAKTPGGVEGHTYEFVDTTVKRNKPYWYQLAIVRTNGVTTIYDAVVATIGDTHSFIYLPTVSSN